MKKGTLIFKNITLKSAEIHKLRGYIGNVYKEYDLVHNHDFKTGKPIYRYPLIQFKLVDGQPTIIAFSEPAIQIFSDMFLKLEKVDIGGRIISIHQKDFNLEEVAFGYTEAMMSYRFLSPWVALNQKNYKRFIETDSRSRQKEMLKRAFIGNILSMAKGLGYWLSAEQKINACLDVKRTVVKLKNQSFIGFTGFVKTNFDIPDYTAIGKSISRGYGVVQKV